MLTDRKIQVKPKQNPYKKNIMLDLTKIKIVYSEKDC